MAQLDRDELLQLLAQLDNTDEAAVVAAAGELNKRLRDAEATWDDLLAWDFDDGSDDDLNGDLTDDDAVDTWDATAEDDGDAAPEQAGEAAKLIAKLLKDFKLTAETREDLEDFKQDIADGTLAADDVKYIQGLHDRLSKSK